MGVREVILGAPRGIDGLSLAEKYEAAQVNQGFLEETIQQLETGFADPRWRHMSAMTEIEFSRMGLKDMIDASRSMYLLNPLIQRSVDVTTFYTWAQGCEFTPKSEQVMEKVVKPMIDNDANREELYDHDARVLVDVDQQVEGSLFFAMPTNMFGEVSVRQIPTLEIAEVIHKPGDRAVIMYYRRRWVEQVWDDEIGEHRLVEKEALYPDWRYHPTSKMRTSGSMKIMWESPIIRRKTGGTKMMEFGVPATYSSLPWARAYKEFLEDWHTLVKSLSRFAWKATAKKKPLKKLKDKLQSSKAVSEAAEQADTPATGSIFASTEAADLVAINKSGTSTSADDSRPSRLMVSSGMHVPDNILSGDPQQGALATAKTLDRPYELFIMNRQGFWRGFHQSVFRYAVDTAVRAGLLSGKRTLDRRTGMELIIPAEDATVDITFPPIIEHDITEIVGAINTAAPFIPEEEASRQMLEALSVEDVEEAIKLASEERERRREEQKEEFDEKEEKEIEEAINRLKEAMASVGNTP